MSGPASDAVAPAATLHALGLTVFERGWLSSNNILCDVPGEPVVLIDSGYATHAAQTLALVRASLAARPLSTPDQTPLRNLDLLVNTHLHSDHCGGNALLQATYPNLLTRVPASLLRAVQTWDSHVLTYAATDQRCERYRADTGLAAGDELRIGRHDWQVHAAPGHDPDAVMLFEPTTRTLVSGDALWERRLAIVFPALAGDADAFDTNLAALDAIEALDARLVIPGHGRAFTDVASALASSRKRLAHYRSRPHDHTLHARKALAMFRMLEHHRCDEGELRRWLCTSPVLAMTGARMNQDEAGACIEELVQARVLLRHDGRVELAT